MKIPPPQCPSFPFIPLIPKQALMDLNTPKVGQFGDIPQCNIITETHTCSHMDMLAPDRIRRHSRYIYLAVFSSCAHALQQRYGAMLCACTCRAVGNGKKS
jgi:hypothetical protein